MSKAKDIVYDLERLKWAVAALAQLGPAPGSCEKENAANAVTGIECRIDRIIQDVQQLDARAAAKGE